MNKLLATAIAASALALTACGQQAGEKKDVATAVAESLPDLFQASYRVEALLGKGEEQMTIAMLRHGAKTRMEMNSDGRASAVVINPETNEALIMSNTGPKVAMKMAFEDLPQTPDQQWRAAAGAKASGPCTHIGEVGIQWEVAATADAPAKRACITPDGIILRAEENGVVTWDATKVTRGPQDKSLFGVPADYQVMDMSAMAKKAGEMAKRFQP
jgi:hypothetical protein